MIELTKREIKLAVITGFIAIWIQPIYVFFTSYAPSNALWGHAISTLEWSMILRDNSNIIFVVSISIIASILYYGKINNRWLKIFGYFIIGSIFGLLSIFYILDYAYLRGAFVLLPTTYGIILLSILLAINGIVKFNSNTKKEYKLVNYLAIIFAIYLIAPGIGPMMGISPGPPKYTEDLNGDFEFSITSHVYPMPQEVEEIRGDIEGDIDFSIYLALPINQTEKIPLAIILHGFANPDFESYRDWVEVLSSKGMAVAFIQYPSDVQPEGWDTYVLEEKQGMSNHPYHVPRAIAIEAALDHLNTILPQNIDYSNMLISGHSLGAGYALLVLDSAFERGWANNSLGVDLEAPYARPVQSHLQINLTNIPTKFVAHIAVSEDDMSVDDCFGVYHTELLGEGAIMMQIPSDRHGFPRLVASHYLQATQTHDSLADWGFYRRVVTQADWLISETNQDTLASLEYKEDLTQKSKLQFMGYWSDGTPVKQIETWNNPIESSQYEYCKTWVGN